jgi:small conductance mechanosensitive channel
MNSIVPFQDWVRLHLAAFGLGLLTALLVLLVGVFAAGAASRALKTALMKTPMRNRALLVNFLGRTVRVIVIVFAGVLALSQIGLDIGPLIAGIGITGFIVGFAFKDSLSNLAAGLLLLFYQPFDKGDFVEAGGMQGTVLDMSVAATELRMPDGRLAIVPNSRIWNAAIINFNKLGSRRIEWRVGVAYRADIGATIAALQSVLVADARILADPAPQIVVEELGESSVNFVVRGWVVPKDFGGALSDVRRAIKESLAEQGIEIPFPHRVVVTAPAA